MCSESHAALTCLNTCLLTRGIPPAQKLRGLSNPPIWKDTRFKLGPSCSKHIFCPREQRESSAILAAEPGLLNKERGVSFNFGTQPPRPPPWSCLQAEGAPLDYSKGVYKHSPGARGQEGGTIAKFREVWTEENEPVSFLSEPLKLIMPVSSKRRFWKP